MEKSIKRLILLLQQIKHDAGYALLCSEEQDALQYCIQQYNNIYQRLSSLDDKLAARFEVLPEDTSAGAIRIAARDMASFLIEHLRNRRNWSSMLLLPGAFLFFLGLQKSWRS